MKLTIGLTLLLAGCTCSAPATPPSAPAPEPAAAAPEEAKPVDHGALLYAWHTRLPTGAFTGLRAYQDGFVEIGGSGPRGLAWSPLRQMGPGELALFDGLRNGPDLASLPKLIPDAAAPVSERVSYILTTASGDREILVEGARRTRIPALEAVDKLLAGDAGLPHRSWVSASTASGPREVALVCAALSQRAFRGLALAVQGVQTPDSRLPTGAPIVRVEDASLLRSEVIEVREDGSLVRYDEGGAPHSGQLDAQKLATLRSALDHLPWDKAERLCDP
jgi:hypothetical protein